jgi:hypothetical protein
MSNEIEAQKIELQRTIQLKRTAYHEAGHAVFFHRLGLGVGEVTITEMSIPVVVRNI